MPESRIDLVRFFNTASWSKAVSNISFMMATVLALVFTGSLVMVRVYERFFSGRDEITRRRLSADGSLYLGEVSVDDR